MIPPHKVDEILGAARIEEVIGEFVNLKRSGSSYKGLSPWTDERTPSFMVSPAKGVFKDFSSGKGGNVVSFLMEHEHFSFPEALRWLAKRYNIEVEEEVVSAEAELAKNERESLYIINEFAAQWFTDQMWESEEGQTVGLSYFKERGFLETIIRKFQLGYNPDDFQAFTAVAKDRGYKAEYLLATGLVKEKNEKQYDGYKGRVMFPIHNLSGRIIGFGGRTLKADKSIPKYINSPENLIYNKSNSLYGLYLAKSAIAKEDNCFLVEGYTDVISFHQKHIENTVASSGTALTPDQVKLIARYTQNITLVYDGDRAGIKASLRGIDIILEQGMNVKVVLLPDGHDPDSFSKAHDKIEVKDFLNANARDFIVFKADLLMEDAKGDPVKTNEVIHAMVNSVALIPDAILRSLYIGECSKLMRVSETALISELNKALRKNHRDTHRTRFGREEETPLPVIETDFQDQKKFVESTIEHQERDLLRLMVNYHNHEFSLVKPTEELLEPEKFKVIEFLLDELEGDNITFETPKYQQVFALIAADYEQHGFSESTYIQHQNEEVKQTFIDLLSTPYTLDNWASKEIYVSSEEHKLWRAVLESIYAYKSKRIERMIKQNQQLMRDQVALGADEVQFLKKQLKLEAIKREINKSLGRTVLH